MRSIYVTPRFPMKKTGFDRYFDEQMVRPAVAREYAKARAEVDATDALIRSLDAQRSSKGMSKARLAQKISATPEVVRRLFTARRVNPTMDTVIKLAAALDCHLELVPNRSSRSQPPPIRAPGRKPIARQSADSAPRTRRPTPARRRSRSL